MNNLKEYFNAQFEQISTLDNAIVLLHNKSKTLPELKNLQFDLQEVKIIVNDVKLISHEIPSIKSEYKALMRKLRKQQLILLNLIQKAEYTPPLQYHQENNQNFSNVPDSVQRSVQKMSVSDFQNSPFVNNIKPVSLNFLDFEIQLTQEEFNMIPKYMKGRETLDELNLFLEKTISKSFNDKYSLIFKQRNAVKQCDKELWNRYQMQIKYCPGNPLIVFFYFKFK